MTAPTLRANSELVTEAWIRSIPGWQAGVAAQLPQDTSSWVTNGFVTVQVVGGTPHPYGGIRRPVMGIDAWATQSATPSRTASKPPWNKAAHLAEWILAETLENERLGRLLTLQPATYPKAFLLTAVAITEPRKVYGEGDGIARFTFNLELAWCEHPD